MTLTVRLDPELEREFTEACRLKRTTKSAVVTEFVRGYVRPKASAMSSFELAEAMGLVGCMQDAPASGRDHSRYLKEKLRSKVRAGSRANRTR
jgi:hypothetical protein